MKSARIAAILLLLLTLPLCAETIPVSGLVRAPGGQPAPGVTLAIEGDAAATVFSDASGRFRIPLPPGRYKIRASLLGFLPQEQTIELKSGEQPKELEFTLRMAPLAGANGPRSAASRGGAEFQRLDAQASPESQSPETTAESPAPSAAPDFPRDPEASSDAFVISGNMGRTLAPTLSLDDNESGGRRLGRGGSGPGSRGGNGRERGPSGSGNGPRDARSAGDEERRREFRERAERVMLERGRGGPPERGGGPGGPGGEGGFGPMGGDRGGFAGGGFGGGGFSGVGPGGAEGFGFGFGGGPGFNLNRIRGSVRMRYTNSVFDARPFSFSGLEREKLPYYREQLSFTAGGPLQIPKLFKSKSTSFMLSYEEDRGNNTQDNTSTVPLGPQRTGDFAGISSVAIFDPLTRRPFDGNRIPAQRINSAAAGLLRFLPLPNLPGTTLNYHLQQVLPTSQDRLTVRVSRTLSQRRRSNVFVMYNLGASHSERGQIYPDLFTRSRSRGQNVVVGYTQGLSQRSTNDLRLTFNRMRMNSTNAFAFGEDVMGPLGIQGVSRDPANWGVPTISFSNFGRLSDSNPVLRRNNIWRLSENFARGSRRHTFRVGVSAGWTRNALHTDPNPRGTYSFTGLATSGLGADGSTLLNTGFDFADFLLGLPQSTSIRYGQNNTYFSYHSLGLYAQDDFRLSPRLSVTLGLRYELAPPPVEKYNHIVNLDVARWFTGVAPVLPDESGPYTGHFPRSLIDTDRNNFAPRVGVAWRPLRRRRLILRAGYGLFYHTSVWDQIASQLATQPPFAITTSRLTSAGRVLTLQNPFPPEPLQTVRNSFAADRHFLLPYVQNWSFNIQQDMRRGLMLELGYMGTKGNKLYLIRAPNRAPTGSQLTSEQRRQIGNAEGFLYHTPGANSVFHALQARVHRRFSRGVFVSAGYTWGKSIDNASSIGGSGSVVAQDDTNLRAERGLSSFDQRHRLDIRYSYEFPFGPRRAFAQNGWGARLLGDWEVSGGASFLSGQPFTALVGGNRTNNSGTGASMGGGNSERADSTGLPVRLDDPTVNHFFNTEAFAVPLAGHFGSAGRNVIPGPGSLVFNSAVARSIRLRENGVRAEIRLEANNLFNSPAFGGLGTVLNALNFGRLTSARSMRTIQWHARISF